MMMMMTVMRRIMTWIIIVNESRKQSNKLFLQVVWKKTLGDNKPTVRMEDL